MFKKLLQTAFICLALGVFAQEKDRLGVPGPLVFENEKGDIVTFELSKSGTDQKDQFIVQEYTPKSKSMERVTITLKSGTEVNTVLNDTFAKLKAGKKAQAIETTEIGDQKYLVKYQMVNDKKDPERREMIVGSAKTESGPGTYIIEYSGGNFIQMLNVEKLYEINITPVY